MKMNHFISRYSASCWVSIVLFAGIFFFGAKKITAQSECNSFLSVQIGQKWGFIDRKGNIVIPPFFDFAEDFADGRALVENDGLWGIIDEQGKWVMPPRIKFPMLSVKEQRIRIRENGKARFIDTDGKPIPGVFDDAGSFVEGLADVKIGNKWGYIDRAGKTIIAPSFDEAGYFSEGKAEVTLGKSNFYIDRTGRKLFDVPPDMIITSFYEGLARFQQNSSDLYGFVDARGRVVIKPKFRDAGDFFEGLAKVEIGYDWGFIDKKGKVVIEPKYRDVNNFSEGLASVKVGDEWGFIRKDGTWAIPPKFYDAFDFVCGIAFVELEDSKGYIDTTGNFVFFTQKKLN